MLHMDSYKGNIIHLYLLMRHSVTTLQRCSIRLVEFPKRNNEFIANSSGLIIALDYDAFNLIYNFKTKRIYICTIRQTCMYIPTIYGHIAWIS